VVPDQVISGPASLAFACLFRCFGFLDNEIEASRKYHAKKRFKGKCTSRDLVGGGFCSYCYESILGTPFELPARGIFFSTRRIPCTT